jgi:hypothetical protein
MLGMANNTQPRRNTLGAHLTRCIAAEAPADPRSIEKLLRGEPVAPICRERIMRALEARGLAHLVVVEALKANDVTTTAPNAPPTIANRVAKCR